jgi:hypothetical protein
VRTFFITLSASVLVLVIAEVVLGWTFDAAEISFIVLIILVITIATTKVMTRNTRNGKDAKN